MEISIKNNTFNLLPQKAIYWKEKKALIIADVHLGKTAMFRKFSIPVPTGNSTSDLAIISNLIKSTEADKVILLGDFFHNKIDEAEKVFKLTYDWRISLSNIEFYLTMGNHDRLKDRFINTFNFIVDDRFIIDDFIFSHKHLIEIDKFCFSGHIHPRVQLSGKLHEFLKLPCFLFKKNYAVLPSFGGFTGGHIIYPGEEDKIFVIAGDEVIPIK